MTTRNEFKLLPCPFCGMSPKHDLHANPNVWCNNDKCTLVGLVFSGGPRHWNARALAAHPPVDMQVIRGLPNAWRKRAIEILDSADHNDLESCNGMAGALGGCAKELQSALQFRAKQERTDEYEVE